MEVTPIVDTTTDVGYEQQQQQQPYYELYTSARFITGLILYPIICLFGLTGNALSPRYCLLGRVSRNGLVCVRRNTESPSSISQ